MFGDLLERVSNKQQDNRIDQPFGNVQIANVLKSENKEKTKIK